MSQFFAQLTNDMTGGPITAAAVDDALTVAAALVHACAPLTVDRLATALGWPPDRVTNALHDAEQYPDITDPITLQRTELGTYAITARVDRLSTTQRQALSLASGGCDPVE
jgi:hypothetical protein